MKFGKHKCIECGYLCYELEGRRFLGERSFGFGTGFAEYEDVTSYSEITNRERNEELISLSSTKGIVCYRRLPEFEVEIERILKAHESSESKELPELDKYLEMTRKCRYYIRHISGYSPGLHLTRWEANDRERSNRWWNFLYLLLGMVLTIIGGLIVKVLSSP